MEVKTDRQLLERAAKAAGIQLLRWNVMLAAYETNEGLWNPWHSAGEALRLVVKLHLHILHNEPGEKVLWVSAVVSKKMISGVEEFADEGEREAAACRAIVRCAAEVGRGMP